MQRVWFWRTLTQSGGAFAKGGEYTTSRTSVAGGAPTTVTTSAGGASATGGTGAFGGTVATGGSAGTGGVPATGGAPASGGDIATGGVPATLSAGNFMGFGLSFNICGDATATFGGTNAGVSAAMGGTLNNAALKWQIETSNDAPIDTTTGRGECAYTSESSKWSDCMYNTVNVSLPSSVSTLSYTWSQFTGDKPVTSVDKNEIIGLQWQVECPFGGSSCAIDITFDEINFHT